MRQLPWSFIMHVRMFYLLDKILISSLISSAVTHLTLKNSLCIASYLSLPTVLASRLPAGELEVADSVGGCVCLYLCKCVDKSVLDGAFAQ